MEILLNKLIGIIALTVGVISLRNWNRVRDEERLLSITTQQFFKGGLLSILVGLILLFTEFKIIRL